MSTSEAGEIHPGKALESRSPLVEGGTPLPVAPDHVAPDHVAPHDDALVSRTQREIRQLVSEIARLAKSDSPPAEFYQAMLSRAVSAMAAVAGAVWIVGPEGKLELVYQVNFRQTGIAKNQTSTQRHGRLLSQVLTSPQGMVVAPGSGNVEAGEAANPTEHLLIAAPMSAGREPLGVIEIFQRPGGGPVTQRGYLRFLLQICEIAGEYLRNRQLREFEDRQSLWGRAEQFTRAVHQTLDPNQTAFAIANEGRRLIECDRLTVTISHGSRRNLRVAAISNQETFDRRSNTVRSLSRLATDVAATGEALWYAGKSSQCTPKVQASLDTHMAESRAKAIGVFPLTTSDDPRKPDARRVVGALVLEHFETADLPDDITKRYGLLIDHATAALANSLSHDGLFLLPLWQALGRARWVVAARALPKTIVAIFFLAAVTAALGLIPANFDLAARGSLEPALRRQVFVRTGGVVINVPVRHGQQVTEGEVIVELRNRNLEISMTETLGRRTATEEQMRSIRRARNNPRLAYSEQNRLAGRFAELEKTYESLSQQLQLLKAKQELLKVKSPITGQVTSWDVHNRLIQRPVEKGQVLLSVADTDGRWEIELRMPEHRMGHLSRAAARPTEAGQGLEVTFILATDPGQAHRGTVKEIQTTAEVHGEAGNTVLIRVAFDREELQGAELRPGATVTAKIQCGRRSLGYVWFHDLIEFVQAKILFKI